MKNLILIGLKLFASLHSKFDAFSSRETVEVRRNPMRVSKKNIDKDFPRSKQRLLVNSRREIRTNYETNKRIKSGTMSYMKTRSVTRKMYTVGATYQAPTKKDETEWKEWPVHGMHERPVYHPQVRKIIFPVSYNIIILRIKLYSSKTR